jgi:hypothetical protein
MRGGFVLLWSKILQSSIWDEHTATRVVWITMLAMKDENGLVVSTFDSLRRAANVTPEECQVALDKFLAPDPASGSTADEGRRIRKAHGGWTIINHEKYRYSSEERRIYWREKKAEQRQKRTKKVKQFLGAPKTFAEKVEEGNDCLSNRL